MAGALTPDVIGGILAADSGCVARRRTAGRRPRDAARGVPPLPARPPRRAAAVSRGGARVPAEHTYDYAIVRVVPRVERGRADQRRRHPVVRRCGFPRCAHRGRCARLLALDPTLDLEAMRANLATIPAVCRGRRGSRTDRRAAAARALSLARLAAQHDHSDVAGAYGPDEPIPPRASTS